jgi:hypothetical protein
MDFQPFFQDRPVQGLDVVGSYIYLPVIFPGVKLCKFEKVDLNVVFLHHQVAFVISASKLLKAQTVQVKFPGNGFVPHGYFRVDVREHLLDINWYESYDSFAIA